jgi:nicotinamide-nucleotide amidase
LEYTLGTAGNETHISFAVTALSRLRWPGMFEDKKINREKVVALLPAEVLCVGSELLLGQIVNTNATFLAQELAGLGIPHFLQTVVGDNTERIHEVLDQMHARVPGVLITTGGLGPTPDDLTHESLASYFGVPMVEHPEILKALELRYQKRNRVMSPSNRKQASFPKGAMVLPNPTGTAPGIIWEARPDFVILTFPGVPSEMKAMWQQTAVPFLIQRYGSRIFYSRTLLHWGVSESDLAEKAHAYLEQQNPTVAPYASMGVIKLRVTAAAPDLSQAKTLIEPTVQALKELGGSYYFGEDEDTLASVVGGLLIQRGQTLAVAESCTGGWLAKVLTDQSGSSRFFVGGTVAYGDQVKTGLLGIDPQTIREQGAVSSSVALQMAKAIRKSLGADWGIAVTGISGPSGGTEDKPVGLVHLGIVGPGVEETFEYRFGENWSREWIRWLSVQSALDRVRHFL